MISQDFTQADRAHLVRFVRNRVRDRETAEDIAQEALLRAQKFEFRGESTFTTWLYKIAKNLCIDHYRDRTVETTAIEYGELVSDPRPSALEDIQRCAMHEQVRRAIADLSELDREAIHCFYYEGMNLEQMCEHLGCELSAVKGRLFRARRELRKRLMN